MAFGKTDEQKQLEAEAKAEAARADAERKAAEKFAASPVGQAVAAKERGDGFYQLEVAINSVGGTSGWGSAAARVRNTGGRPDLLGQIEEAGWRLEHVGYVYIETGATSTNRVLSTGQGTITKGFTQGIYLFRNSG